MNKQIEATCVALEYYHHSNKTKTEKASAFRAILRYTFKHHPHQQVDHLAGLPLFDLAPCSSS